ncbi:leucine-rich repeat serine/threonine-protein kinase 1 isoform X1 [Hydra vulgaris]|uniref:leucine-rich repeat serine/threonine-protein kinase 1 isoform X1 n=1 Tax=Hydra vulgaris TaxID=6087 RepID=UPI001F5FCD63|nr:leucine-rich repeat serine/threonine-protein kinase 1 isoform X1 [Hydra vulgaris]
MNIADFPDILKDACLNNDVDKLSQCILIDKVLTIKLLKGDDFYKVKNMFGLEPIPNSYMYIACEHNSFEIVKQLLLHGVCDVSSPSIKNKSPILVACEKGSLECLKEMVSFGISLHPSNTVTKDSCIYVATFFGQTCVVEYIVNSNHDILEKVFEGGLGQSPDISYADIWVGLSSVAKTEKKIKSGSLLLYIACLLKHFDIVKFLLAQGVNANEQLLSTKSFYSSMYVPLAVACKNNDLKIAEILFENGAEITSSIANQYPDTTALLLQSHVKISSECDNSEGNFNFINTSSECYSLCWSNLRLHKLHRHWLSNNSENIYMLDLHDNSIEDIPFDFFILLPNIKEVDLSCNLLRKFPDQNANLSKIIKVVARKNKLKILPLSLFNNPNITHIDFSANEIINLPTHPEKLWECTMLKYLRLSNNKIISIPSSISGANSLEKLYLNDNLIQSFECSWKCPLSELDLSNNQLVEFCPSFQIQWSDTLIKLNLSKNQIESISSSICHLQNLHYLDLSFNTLRVLPPPDLWKCESLCKLNLSHNLLSASTHTDGFVGVDMNKLVEAMGANSNLSVITSCEFPVEIFSENLTNLDLSYNLLENIPESLYFLINIQELNLSNNPCLTVLPAELSLLKNVWNLRLSGLNIPDLPFELNDKNLAKQVMPYLCAKLRKSVSFNRMKLMVVGLQARGKTTLVATLQGKKPPPNISTVGISVEQWSLALPQRLSISFWRDTSNNEEIKFSCWDLAGQHVYYATHQCFLTSNTLYLIVFNVTHGREGVDSLAPWLLNIQSRAPLSRVIIVGTHIDCLPVESKASTLSRLKDEILMKYDKKGFPLIANCNFVSNITSEGLVDLRIEIYNVAKLINESSSHGLSRKKAPLSYIQLYDRILKENEARKEKLLPPILNTDEMLQLAQQNPDNDIYTVEELVTASKFLHENGILLHFNDHMRELNTLYFIDPSWLCEMLSLVVTVRERNPFVLDGYIKKTDLLLVLRNPRLPEKFIPQYLRLLERFEIVLQLDDERFLIPSMLPIKKPDDVDCILQFSYENIKRNYFMHYIPPGFWSRLIARTIIALTRWGTGLSAEVNEEDYKTIFWREGILVLFNNCYFLVESFVENLDNVDQVEKGIAITVASQQRNYSAMAFIVDHLDALITEWYPGLEDVDEFGDSLVSKLIPCPICVSKLENNSLHKKYSFTLNVCALAAVNHQHILCARHPDVSVPLNLLVPDLLLTDLPSEFVISSNNLDFNTAESNRLGEGGSGGVYLGRYKDKQVAIKQFHSATTSRKLTITSEDVETSSMYIPETESSLKMQIEDTKVLKGFSELRQEVAILCRLKHPNIVNFIGVCYRPFCFLLELAPLGSLHSTLVKTKNDKDHSSMVGPLLGELLTLKIALQVARALNYLHDSEIVYRDLKSDNILLWSLNENDCINVKLSDYGISTFATPQGVIGEGGTPGFQAPEVKTGCSYDEKVDMFSYGIWLYELVSGNRPYKEYRSPSEMKRAVQRGVRPSLYKDKIDLKMPYIEELMKDCWQEKPNQRPSAYEVVSRLQNISTYLLKHILEDTNCLNKITCVSKWLPENCCELKNQPLLLLWCQENSNRICIVVDIENKLVVKKVACAGPRVLCLLQVEKFIWLGTEGEQIEVFGPIGSTEERILWSIPLKDHVMSMILYQHQKHIKVLASLANGTLAVFRRLQTYLHEKLSKFSRKADIVDFEKRKWSDVNLIDLETKLPAKCMVLTQFNTELWVGSGNKIVVVDPLSLKIIECIEALRTRHSLITAMVTDESNVWITYRRSSIVTQWCVNTRCLLYSFQCNSLNPLSQMLFTKSAPHIEKQETSLLSPESPESSESLPPDFKTKVSFFKTISNNSDIENDADGFLVSCDSFTFNNVQELSESSVIKNLCDVEESLPESSLIKKFKHSQGLIFKTFKNNSIKKKIINTVDVDDSSILRPRTSALSKKTNNENCYVTCLYYNGNALWIGRSLGDIIILNTKINNEKFGCVIAHLDKMYDKQLNKSIRSTIAFAPLKEYNCLVSVIRIEDNVLEKCQLYHYKAMNIDELFDVENKLFREFSL